ncbi:hypothetical protein BC834DRAFT_966858 [Gloeopeniophorella convolvens]|nr:hypothetical protein BC834DRAFT_966858 [Gloeopeniophorella convolvens]
MPPSPPRHPPPQSPFTTSRLSESPSSRSPVRPPSHHSSSSPLLYTQRSAPSPGSYYRSPSQYDHSFQPPISPTLRYSRHDHHSEPVASSSTHHPPLSRISTAPSSSFPQTLLNPVSPQQSPLGGLEALVQAATAERDRLEAKASLERKTDGSRSAVQRSPELLFRSPHDIPRTQLQAPAPRTPITPSLISGPLLNDSYSESSFRTDTSPEVRPAKRRRQSDSQSGSDRGWDSPPSWDTPASFGVGALMGPGVKPRRSSDVRTEMRQAPSMPLREAEEVITASRRMSPPKDPPPRRPSKSEKQRPPPPSQVQDRHEPELSPTLAPEHDRYSLSSAYDAPRTSIHRDSRASTFGAVPLRRKISQPDLPAERHSPQLQPLQTAPALLGPVPSPLQSPQQRTPISEPVEDHSSRVQAPASHKSSMSVSMLVSAPPAVKSVFLSAVLEPQSTFTETTSSIMQEESSLAVVDDAPPSPVPDVHSSAASPVSRLTSEPREERSAPAEASDAEPPLLPSPKVDDTRIVQNATPEPAPHPRSPTPPRAESPEHVSLKQESEPPPAAPLSPVQSPPPAIPSPKDWAPFEHAPEIEIAVPEREPSPAVVQAKIDVAIPTPPTEEPRTSPSPAPAPPTLGSEPPLEQEEVSRLDDAAAAMSVDIDLEIARELDLAVESVEADSSEPAQVEMDVDEELLSLIEDKPPRSSQSASKRRGPPSPELKSSASHSPLLNQEFGAGRSTPSYLTTSVSAPTIKSERASMPPPSGTVSTRDSEAATPKPEDRLAQKKKASQPKSRPKPTAPTKSKPKAPADGSAPAPSKSKKTPATSTKKSALAARSRSTSVMPPGTTPVPAASESKAPAEAEPEDEADEMEDKLYCVCKTKYDDEKVMIACDRCDEWYHTSCVNMPDLEVDLVDQFICPLCIEKNPHLDLCTTWKRRCLNGLKQRDPASSDACHKPARGAFSKYCSDECGVQYMHMRVSLWIAQGGDRARLWDTVKAAERREGVAVPAPGAPARAAAAAPPPTKATRELARLRGRLAEVVRKREALKAETDAVAWREKLTQLAVQRAEAVEQCGWDQRLCFGDEEVAEFGAGVLESYEEGDGGAEEAEWWCTGKKKCERHAGWQKLRAAEVEFDKEMRDQALEKLTKLEREIRTRVEDILDPQMSVGAAEGAGTGAGLEPSSPLVPTLAKPPVLNGQAKHRPNGEQGKKGKKRKE